MIGFCSQLEEEAGAMPASAAVLVHLKPAELLITRRACEVVTILGSCVSVTMFCGRLKLAAICHGMLPCPREEKPAWDSQSRSFRYLSAAVPIMAAAFWKAGAQQGEIEVKMFGGANLLSASRGKGRAGVGPSNILMATSLLEQEGLTICAYNVGGCCGRKIVFNTQTGEVFHKHLVSKRSQEALV